METKSYRTAAGAKRAAHNYKDYWPMIVELADGTYDWFPVGHRLPWGAFQVSRWVNNQWRPVNN